MPEISSLQSFAADAVEQFTNLIAGPAANLRDGTEHHAVQLPRDLYAHPNVQTEWWYYTGHMTTAGGDHFGFELVFFKRRTDLDRFGIVPLRLLGNPLFLAHFAITDRSGQRFRYAHRKSAGHPWDLKAEADQSSYRLQLDNWRIHEENGVHHLYATLGDDLIFRVELQTTKPPALNGRDGIGVSFKDTGEASRYFSLTRMQARGSITWHGRTDAFTGSAWMDREFGTWRTTDNQKGWDWLAIQLDDNTELMVYLLKNSEGIYTGFSAGTYVDESGQSRHLHRDDFFIENLTAWTSPHTGSKYPASWRVIVPSVEIELTVVPVMADQELDTRGTTMIVYWEGACTADGTRAGRRVSGNAYAELVGYDRSHDQPSLMDFLVGGNWEQQWRSLFG
jgi:predicted secreted hydrolase